MLSIFFGITNFLHGERWCTAWFKRRLPLYLHLPFKCMANLLAKARCGGPRYQQTLRVQVFNASLIVATVREAVTTGLNICEFLMKK